MIIGKINLYYASSSKMAGSTTVDSKFNNCKVFATAQIVSQTPYTTNLWNVVGAVNDGKLTIEAFGSGFVNGHILAVAYLISL